MWDTSCVQRSQTESSLSFYACFRHIIPTISRMGRPDRPGSADARTRELRRVAQQIDLLDNTALASTPLEVRSTALSFDFSDIRSASAAAG
ncbi:hypothetical protein [Caballeronia sordidicola]|uniref:hypothetical protein n=1 Tax=Caballeronia sordidicola TaxID=196367 RepID=UPI000AEE3D71|nr:hypothetical protein [Caballeronia sordidicola]